MVPQHTSCLIVENQADTTRLIRDELEKLNSSISIEVLRSEGQFLQHLNNQRPGVVIFPEHNASFTWREALKALGNTFDNVPLIVVSQSGSEEQAVDAMLNGAADYMSLSNLHRLVPAVKRELKKHSKARELQETREQHKMLLKSIDGIVWEADAQTFDFNYVSPQSKRILGYEPEQWYDSSFWRNHIHPDDRQEAVNYCHNKSKQGENHSFEYRMLKADGNVVWLRDHVTVISENGKPSQLRGLMMDITEQKKLQRQRDKAYQVAEIGHWELDIRNKSLHWSQILKQLHEVPMDYEPTLEEALNFYPEDQQKLLSNAVSKAMENGNTFDLELKIVTAKGNARWVRVVGETDMNNGECTRILGTTQNITQRRQAEDALRDRELHFKSLVQEASELIAIIDSEGIYKYAAPTSYRTKELGKSGEEFIGKSCFDFIHQDDRDRLKAVLKNLEENEQQKTEPFRFKNAEGNWRWLEATVTNLTTNPAIQGYVTNSKDITQTIEQQKKLKDALERYKYVTRATDDVIYDWDIKKNELYWDDSFHTKFISNITGGTYRIETWEKNVHPDDLAAVKQSLEQTLQSSTKNKWEQEYRFKRKDEGFATVFERGFILRNEAGEPLRMIGSLEDITERKQSENDLRQSLQEKETLLLEIHHRVKNNLAVVSGMMQLQAFNEENKALKEKLFDSVTRIQTMGAIHELLYQSESFAELDFDENVERLVAGTIDTFRPDLELQTEFSLERIDLNINQAIPCSLIVNEIITNILKHAFNGRSKGYISIEMHQKNEQIILIIEDDGSGLPDDFGNTDNIESLGLKLINTLANQLEASYNYQNISQGARFELRFTKADVKGVGNARL